MRSITTLEHTLLVTLVGRDILHGSLTYPIKSSRTITAISSAPALLHDIGYVRGILSGDTESEYVINQEQAKIALPRAEHLMPH